MDRKTGVAVPLAALYTKKNSAIGEFTSLKPFGDFCKKCGLSVIQLLPVNDTGTQSSPYSGLSAFALHPIYIDISSLPEFSEAFEKDKAFCSAYKNFFKQFKYSNRFNYEAILQEKTRLLHLLFSFVEKKIQEETKTQNTKPSNAKVKEITVVAESDYVQKFNLEMEHFIKKNPWVISYAVYKNLKDIANQASWKEWNDNLKHLSREQIKLRWNNRALRNSHNFFVWCQMRASQQLQEASAYLNSLDIILKGDIPILMNEDSADIWTNPEFFNEGLCAGSPPDGENRFGQNWGFPTYNWERLEADNYSWWKERITSASDYYAAIRLDHILGFFRMWTSSKDDTTAYSGYTVPFRTISKKQLMEKGFSEERIRWLSKSHIPTSLIQDITKDYKEAHKALSKVAQKLEGEELWLFRKKITGDRKFYEISFNKKNPETDFKIKAALSYKWRDRTLIEVKKNHFTFTWNFGETLAWQTLNPDEQKILLAMKKQLSDSEEKLFRRQGMNILTAISSASPMVLCAEDLGAIPKAVPDVLQKLDIMSLKVIRWNRKWNIQNQPFYRFSEYPSMSVTTTSVHDSPTLRQWWINEKQSVSSYLKLWDSNEVNPLFTNMAPVCADDDFCEKTAAFCLESAAFTGSAWYVNPLQDYLYLDSKYYLEDPELERINIPGTVNDFNWTYRMPVAIEDLMENKRLINHIHQIVQIHDSRKAGGGKR